MKAYRILNGNLDNYIHELCQDGCNLDIELTNNIIYTEKDMHKLKYDIMCLSRLNHVGFIEGYETFADGSFKCGSEYYEYEDVMNDILC